MIQQGEKLLLLVKRSGQEANQIAKQMGYTRQYLAKLYKKEVLPGKAKDKAIEVFNLPTDYFESEGVGSSSSDHQSHEDEKDKEIARLKKLVEEKEKRIMKLIDLMYGDKKEGK